MRPIVGGEWCQARHVGFVISGRLGIEFADGTSAEFGPGDVFDIPPGHDGYTIGDEPCVQVEWSGLRAWAGFPTGIHSRVLATLLFTDIVGSTTLAAELGDARWRELLSEHFVASARRARALRRDARSTRPATGCWRRFDGPARALHCAAAIQRCAEKRGVQDPYRGARRRGRARRRRRTRRRRPRGRAHHGGRGAGRDPRLGSDAWPRRGVRAPLRGSRHARAQGARRRVASVRFRPGADERAPAHPGRRRGLRGARADHGRAPALRPRLPRDLRPVDGGRARAARGATRRRTRRSPSCWRHAARRS